MKVNHTKSSPAIPNAAVSKISKTENKIKKNSWIFFSADLTPKDDKYCASRINYRTKEPATCCSERDDDCTFDMGDGVSYFFLSIWKMRNLVFFSVFIINIFIYRANVSAMNTVCRRMLLLGQMTVVPITPKLVWMSRLAPSQLLLTGPLLDLLLSKKVRK